MKQQLDLLDKIVHELKADPTVTGVMVIGSVADGTANEYSDLDLLIMCDRDKYEAKFIENILVEYIFMHYDTALYKLQNIGMEVYRYLNGRIIYDDGQLQELMTVAANRYDSYKTKAETQKEIYYWLLSMRIKIHSSLTKDDSLKTNYLTAAGSWRLIEAVWAVNNKPMPPSGSITKFLKELEIIPEENWFEKLFSGNDSDRTTHMVDYINWAIPKLKIK